MPTIGNVETSNVSSTAMHQCWSSPTDSRDGGLVAAHPGNAEDLFVYVVATGGSAPSVGDQPTFVLAPGETLQTKLFGRFSDVYVVAAAAVQSGPANAYFKAIELIGADVEALVVRRYPTPTQFLATDASTATTATIFTPASGKRFRLLGYSMSVPWGTTASSAGIQVFTLTDGGGNIQFKLNAFIPAVTPAASGPNAETGWVDLTPGFLSGAANNILGINCPVALAPGKVRCLVKLTEEDF